jgi:glycosyltransferase involved in cell wall biosynthesis
MQSVPACQRWQLLVVMTHHPCSPRWGSTVVAFNQIKHLSTRHAVDLVCLNGSSIPGSDSMFEHVEVVGQSKFSLVIGVSMLRAVFGLVMGKPVHVSQAASRSMKQRVAAMVQARHYDALLLYELSAIQYCPRASLGRVVANIEDPPLLKLQRLLRLRVLSAGLRALLIADAVVNQRYERRVLPAVGRVLVLSPEDAESMRNSGASNVESVPYGVEIPPTEELRTFDERDQGTIIISGNMFHLPNVDGVLHFMHQVFPRVLKDMPVARLLIVGTHPDTRIVQKAREFGGRAVVTGRVEDVGAYLQRAVVSVCPVRLRIGVQTKILEALSWGTPVVTTPEGNSGVGAQPGSELWVEQSPDRQAARIVELLQGTGWTAMSNAGRRLVQERFNWVASTLSLERHIEAVAASQSC